MTEKSNQRKYSKVAKQRAKAKLNIKKRVKGKPSKPANQNSLFSALSYTASRAIKILIIFVLLIGFLLAGFGSGMLAGYISTAKPLEIVDMRSFKENTILLDKNGNELAELTSGSNVKREYVSYDDVKDTYIDDAFIAIEDERFTSHPGIDAKRIVSSILSALANAGTPTHGGSTITQQTIKMISGQDDISAQRKIQEWTSAIELEKTLSKEGILELYLNLVPLSNNIVGIGAAAQTYFNKEASELNLLECAFLAGIPNQPAIYNPLTEHGRRNALRRMRTTLSKMADLGIISEEEYQESLDSELIFDFSYTAKAEDNVYSWPVEYVIAEVISDLITKNGYSQAMASLTVFNQSLIIETTIDPEVQNNLEEVFKDKDLISKDPEQIPDSPESPQAGITVLENNLNDPGRIRGMIGGFGEKKNNFIFNRATDAKRQPASAIKPLVVYGPGIDSGLISDATIFTDKAVYLDPLDPNRAYPENYYQNYLGRISLEQALINSTNTVAADVFMNIVKPEVGLSYLKMCGIDRDTEQFPSTALGGFAEGVSTLEMAGAYSTLANEGIYVKPTSYSRVLRNDGTVLLDNSAPPQTAVFNPTSVYVLTKNLEKVAENSGAKPENVQAAGKTGTSEDAIDVWFCGYTPYYTAAVWYGYDNTNGRKIQIPEVDFDNASAIWNACMTEIHSGLENLGFGQPDGITVTEVCSDSGLLASEYCTNPFSAFLIDGSNVNPISRCNLHTAPTRTTPKTEETEPEQTEPTVQDDQEPTTAEPQPDEPPEPQPDEPPEPEE
ncbi:MAG: penicillin-binding protein [Clostridiaceae bacterium]|jgi:penicillin-binding protein 1A|nr:penicillin-binding protein [Clostridiaceae bacterium]